MTRVVVVQQLNQCDFVGQRKNQPRAVFTTKEWASVATVCRRFGCGDVLEGATCLDSRYLVGLRKAFARALACVDRPAKKKKAASGDPDGFRGTMRPTPRVAAVTNAPSKEERALIVKLSDFIETHGRQGLMVKLTFPD